MNSLPNYDAWRLATPSYLEPNPPCICGGDFEDHEELDTQDPPGRTLVVCHCGEPTRLCRCSEYVPADERDFEPDPDDAYDRRREREDW